ncbi:tRNA(Ile)-lysidine synthetase [Fervidobacterium nodosum Rt17-B1]|uniref:tRNA(Ile)-lysidine synthase n=1 Tax=Fervidobacterium nodosum (strain ATCC 35602 / DSM 5306 / Rt17-B1) TaxID=381764 RepID=A7HJE2_FERNB|nr:tRNA(Ile)-lysidine synthetase [Fervidobacterium nodosum Rt17-B1]
MVSLILMGCETLALDTQDEFFKKFVNFIREYVPNCSSVLLAVSGGVDSIVMLDLFNRAKDELLINIGVATFNHKLRTEADDEVIFVQKFCEGLGIPFFPGEADVKMYCEQNKLSIEEGARILRYEFLKRTAKENGYSFIATAHNANDLLETIILRQIKGTGPFGLAAIKPINGIFIRPLIFFTRKEIEEYAKERKLEYVIDRTNFDIEYNRNFVRHKIVPLLKEINPSVESAYLKLAKNIWELDSYVDRAIGIDKSNLEKIGNNFIFKLVNDEYLQIEQIRRYSLLLFGKPLDYEKLERFKKARSSGKPSYKISFWGALGIEISYGWCMMGDIVNYPVFEKIVCFDGSKEFELIEANGYFIKFAKYDIINKKEHTNVCFKVRNWRGGDRLLSGKKVKELFSERKVPTFLRKLIPLVFLSESEQDSKVIYIPFLYEAKSYLNDIGVFIETKGGFHFES